MKKLLFCFWTMWSATQVSRSSDGGLTFTGGYRTGIGPPGIYSPSLTKQMNKYKPGDIIWNKTGLFFDTKKDCEKAVAQIENQMLLCLPVGIQ